MLEKSFQRNSQDVSAEVVDGEAIIINVASGVYYSLDNVGAAIWSLLESGLSLQHCLEALLRRYAVSAERLRLDLEGLVTQLLEEDLITECVAESTPPLNSLSVDADRAVYDRPELNIYRDMADLLALDPPTPGLSLTPWEATPEQDS
jgi:hypothetical protein